jgi:hypothetical protein
MNLTVELNTLLALLVNLTVILFTMTDCVGRGEEDESLLSVNCLRITFDEELQLSLYRHWSLFDSLCHSINTACRFKVWTLKGQKRLHEYLAEMG